MPRPVRPRDAATLVPWRRAGSGLEVLMGRRARHHRFVPDYYVFPGGRVDRRDYGVAPRSPLRGEVFDRLCRSASPRLAHALAVAAVRETWEETGLLLGSLSGAGLRPDLGPLDYALRAITPSDSPVRYHARFFTVEGSHLAGTPKGNGELVDLAWRPIAECLTLQIVDVTEFFLRRLQEGRAPGAAPEVPLFAFRNGKALLA